MISVGNLDSKRAYLHVDDTIEAILDIVLYGKSPEAYNISGDILYSGKDVVTTLEKVVGKKINTRPDKSRLRFLDEPVIFGDSTKLRKLNGWRPKKTIFDIALDHFQ